MYLYQTYQSLGLKPHDVTALLSGSKSARGQRGRDLIGAAFVCYFEFYNVRKVGYKCNSKILGCHCREKNDMVANHGSMLDTQKVPGNNVACMFALRAEKKARALYRGLYRGHRSLPQRVYSLSYYTTVA